MERPSRAAKTAAQAKISAEMAVANQQPNGVAALESDSEDDEVFQPSQSQVPESVEDMVADSSPAVSGSDDDETTATASSTEN